MGGGKSQAAGSVAAATIYTGGRITTNALAWVQSLAVAGLQVAALKALLDRQKGHYDDIANQQIGFVEQAVNDYLLTLNNDLLPSFPDAFPDVPQAAPYVPVDVQLVGFNQMVENLANIAKTEEYTVRVNHLARYNYLARMAILSPGFLNNIQQAAYQIGDLLHGRMPTGDVVEILTSQAEQDCLTGRIGASHKTTHRNLGISRLRAQAVGRNELAKHAQMLNNDVSPISAEATIHQQMISPANRLALAIQESQLIQQSLQNIYNTAAQKAPYKLAQVNAKMQAAIARLTYSANKGNMVNQFVPNYAAVFGPALQSLTGSLMTDKVDKAGEWQHPAGPEQAQSNNSTIFST
jgi:hypothetical protein